MRLGSKKPLSVFDTSNDDFIEEQFVRPPTPIPWKSILLAITLLVLGSLGIILGALIMTGFLNTGWDDRGKPVLFIGAILFIPGAYHVRIAYYSYKGYDGYDFNQIPDY